VILRRLRDHALLLTLLIVVQLRCAEAWADARRVVLVDPGPALEHAARTALEPWQVDILVVSAPSPGASAPAAQAQAQLIAQTHDAGTVVWVSEHAAGYALWMYDRAAHHAVARPLSSAPPFDAPGAAAVALSLKTLLRHSQSAPEQERFGSSAPKETPAPGPTTQTELSARAQAPADESTAPTRATDYDVDALAAVRFNFLSKGSEELRFGLGASVWPRGRWGGLALRAELGRGIAIKETHFAGTLSALTTHLSGRARWHALRWLRLSGALGVSADFTRLDGFAPSHAQATARAQRVVASLTMELAADWLALPWLRIGVRGNASWLPIVQRYLVRGEPVLELSRASFEGLLVLGFGSPMLNES
jgi:hypothetical protein